MHNYNKKNMIFKNGGKACQQPFGIVIFFGWVWQYYAAWQLRNSWGTQWHFDNSYALCAPAHFHWYILWFHCSNCCRVCIWGIQYFNLWMKHLGCYEMSAIYSCPFISLRLQSTTLSLCGICRANHVSSGHDMVNLSNGNKAFKTPKD